MLRFLYFLTVGSQKIRFSISYFFKVIFSLLIVQLAYYQKRCFQTRFTKDYFNVVTLFQCFWDTLYVWRNVNYIAHVIIKNRHSSYRISYIKF